MLEHLGLDYSSGVLLTGLTVFLALLSYFGISGPSSTNSSRKARLAKDLRHAYNLMESGAQPSISTIQEDKGAPMAISELWVYPIKSIRGCKVSSAMITREGFYLDRRFMLLKVEEETPRKLQNMLVSRFPSMCLFQAAIQGDQIIVSYTNPSSNRTDSIELPLEPENFADLEKIPIEMHRSPTTGYDMGAQYSTWFSERFGFKVVLAFWGGNPRPVLGNRPGKPPTAGPRSKSFITTVLDSVPILGSFVRENEDNIAFSDCAPFLVVTDASIANVSDRLGDHLEMDPSKFRPNIIVKGSPEAFAEDYWAELVFGKGTDKTRIILTGNCGRCASLNVDYNTGAFGQGKDGQVLKLLQKDRRVDLGNKYSPIFGRYGFPGRDDVGKVLRVGGPVVLSKSSQERTRFYWPGLAGNA